MKPLALLAVVAACGGRPEGRYLFIDGEQQQIEFDRVELVFAHPVGDRVPTSTPAATTAEAGKQILLKREHVGETGFDAPLGRQLDLYLSPELIQNSGVGAYVLVVAWRGGEPVGIGEYWNFQQDAADITRFQVPLRPYANAELEWWGREADGSTPNDCVRWRRQVSTEILTIAIGRSGDLDCDAYPDDEVDCDDRAYCDGAAGEGCEFDKVACADAEVCLVGKCFNGIGGEMTPRTCTPTICLMDTACGSDPCDPRLPPSEYLYCAAHPDTHLDAAITTKDDGTLCQQPMEIVVPIAGAACTNPTVEWAHTNEGIWSPYRFEVRSNVDVPGTCTLLISGPPGARFEPHHVMIAVDVTVVGSPVPVPRAMFTLGVKIGAHDDECPEPLVTLETQDRATLGSCLPVR